LIQNRATLVHQLVSQTLLVCYSLFVTKSMKCPHGGTVAPLFVSNSRDKSNYFRKSICFMQLQCFIVLFMYQSVHFELNCWLLACKSISS